MTPLTPTVVPTSAWIAAHRECQHFDGTCNLGNVDYVPVVYVLACCMIGCGQPATQRRGGEVFFPMCDTHYEATR